MKKYKIGNDFKFAWAIEENGVAVDLSLMQDAEVRLRVLAAGL